MERDEHTKKLKKPARAVVSWAGPGKTRAYASTKVVRWPIGRKKSEFVLPIPAGTEFESSVPRALHWLWSPNDPAFLLSALVHDYLIENGWDRDFADSQWLAAARKSGAPKWRAMLARTLMLLRRWWLNDNRGITWRS